MTEEILIKPLEIKAGGWTISRARPVLLLKSGKKDGRKIRIVREKRAGTQSSLLPGRPISTPTEIGQVLGKIRRDIPAGADVPAKYIQRKGWPLSYPTADLSSMLAPIYGPTYEQALAKARAANRLPKELWDWNRFNKPIRVDSDAGWGWGGAYFPSKERILVNTNQPFAAELAYGPRNWKSELQRSLTRAPGGIVTFTNPATQAETMGGIVNEMLSALEILRHERTHGMIGSKEKDEALLNRFRPEQLRFVFEVGPHLGRMDRSFKDYPYLSEQLPEKYQSALGKYQPERISLGKLNYLFNPAEIIPRIADVKRYYAFKTGKLPEIPEEIEQALLYYVNPETGPKTQFWSDPDEVYPYLYSPSAMKWITEKAFPSVVMDQVRPEAVNKYAQEKRAGVKPKTYLPDEWPMDFKESLSPEYVAKLQREVPPEALRTWLYAKPTSKSGYSHTVNLEDQITPLYGAPANYNKALLAAGSSPNPLTRNLWDWSRIRKQIPVRALPQSTGGGLYNLPFPFIPGKERISLYEQAGELGKLFRDPGALASRLGRVDGTVLTPEANVDKLLKALQIQRHESGHGMYRYSPSRGIFFGSGKFKPQYPAEVGDRIYHYSLSGFPEEFQDALARRFWVKGTSQQNFPEEHIKYLLSKVEAVPRMGDVKRYHAFRTGETPLTPKDYTKAINYYLDPETGPQTPFWTNPRQLLPYLHDPEVLKWVTETLLPSIVHGGQQETGQKYASTGRLRITKRAGRSPTTKGDIGQASGQWMNAPTFAYVTVYGKQPENWISGRTSHPQKNWKGIQVDTQLRDEWLDSLAAIPSTEVRASCAGHGSDRPTFVIFRLPPDQEHLSPAVASILNQRSGVFSKADIGAEGHPRICVASKLWSGRKGWAEWWKRLPQTIQKAIEEAGVDTGVPAMGGTPTAAKAVYPGGIIIRKAREI